MARRTLTIKRIDPWSVLKVGFLANLVLLGILLLAGRVTWFFIERLELIDRACEVASSVGFQDCGLNGGNIFRNALLLGLLGVVVQTGILVFASFLHNLISELTGGLSMTVVDDGPDARVAGTKAQRSGRPADPKAAGRSGRPAKPVKGEKAGAAGAGAAAAGSALGNKASEVRAKTVSETPRPTPGSGAGRPTPPTGGGSASPAAPASGTPTSPRPTPGGSANPGGPVRPAAPTPPQARPGQDPAGSGPSGQPRPGSQDPTQAQRPIDPNGPTPGSA